MEVTKGKERIFTWANIVSSSRGLASPFIAWSILSASYLITTGLMLWVFASELLDGWLARRYRQITALGGIIDAAADKLVIAALFVSLLLANGFPIWAWLLFVPLLVSELFLAVLGLGYLILGVKVSRSDIHSDEGKLKMFYESVLTIGLFLRLNPFDFTPEKLWLEHGIDYGLFSLLLAVTVYALSSLHYHLRDYQQLEQQLKIGAGIKKVMRVVIKLARLS